ncbi:MAG: DUF2007 domain-containing protein [Flavobacteriaceae bacterium]|nr:DUF2007 domain-containing protein [Flavobacteriaceae bacterium]
MKKFITLHTFYNPVEAEIVRARLESEGIRAFLLDQNLTYTQVPVMLSGIRLQVERDDVMRAKQILEKSLQNPE